MNPPGCIRHIFAPSLHHVSSQGRCTEKILFCKSQRHEQPCVPTLALRCSRKVHREVQDLLCDGTGRRHVWPCTITQHLSHLVAHVLARASCRTRHPHAGSAHASLRCSASTSHRASSSRTSPCPRSPSTPRSTPRGRPRNRSHPIAPRSLNLRPHPPPRQTRRTAAAARPLESSAAWKSRRMTSRSTCCLR